MGIGTQSNLTNGDISDGRPTVAITKSCVQPEKQELPITRLECNDTETRILGNEKQVVALTKAYAGFFGEVSNPLTKASNPFFNSKYADLQTVLNTVRPIMKKYGLGIMQTPYISKNNYDGKDLKVFRNKGSYDIGTSKLLHVQTILVHQDGGMIIFPSFSGVIAEYNADKEIQVQGALVTYLRRFAINGILGINGEPDDDGNQISGNSASNNTIVHKPATPRATKTSNKVIKKVDTKKTTTKTKVSTATNENKMSLEDKRVFFVQSMKKLNNKEQKTAVECIKKVLGNEAVSIEKMTEQQLDAVAKECKKNGLLGGGEK